MLNGSGSSDATNNRRQYSDLRILIVWVEKLEDAALFPTGMRYY
jgi:hypothetical protein